ncbi:MAG: DUF1015 domain-containing protein [Ktedonobacteraceae bacterium]
MAEVRPLRGIRYVAEKVGDIAQVVTPPYDVITKEAQANYYARSPYNVIRLELGQAASDDNTLNNVYTRAAATLSEWRLQHALQEEATPCYYVYQQTFAHAGQQYTRTSLIARVRLEPWSAKVVLPHEHTMAKAKDDRLKLLRACAANLSPVMSLYDDPQGRIRRLLASQAQHAEIHITDEAGEEHRLHPIRDVQQIAHIQDFFTARQLYIADGHHRYETALAYRQEILQQRKELHPEDAVNFMLMALIDVDDPGMLVLPTHRMLFGLGQDALDALTEAHLAQYFTVQALPATLANDTIIQHMADAGQAQSALVVATEKQTLLLLLNAQGKQRMQASGHSAAWNSLDVAVAQHLVLESIVGLNAEDMAAGTHVRYTRDPQQALQAIQSGETQAAILLNATRVRQIRDVAQADDRMPQKSTYFYPKLITGLVINPLW